MDKNNIENGIHSPEDVYNFSDASLERVRDLAERLKTATESIKENIDDLKEQLKETKTNEERTEIESEIERHNQGLALNLERLGDFEDTIAYWEKELKKAATEILEEFTPDKRLPN